MRVNEVNVLKDIKFKDTAKAKLIAGIDKMADAVGSTLGASGRTVLIEGDFGAPHITKDGVTVAGSIILEDPVENLGVTLVKEAAKNTASRAGDGTTTSTVLTQAIIHAYEDLDGDSVSFRDIRSSIEKIATDITKKIDKRSVRLDDKRLEQVSIISTNNDTDLGGLIADAFKSVGEDGIVTVEQSKTNETKVDVVEGTKLINSCVIPHFFTNPEKETCELDNPLVFLSQSEIPNLPKILPIIEHAMKSNRSLLIISSLDNQVTSALARNKMQGNIKVNVVEPPSFGHKRKDLLEDLALLLGAKVFDESLGDSIDSITPEMLGSAEKAISDIDGTVLVASKTQEVEDKINEIKELVQAEDHPILKTHLEQRLSLLNGGVAIIKVGGDTEIEVKEKLDRVDDAVSAVKAAQKDGILPGGGSALKFFASAIKSDDLGSKIMKVALNSPFNKILGNAGLNPEDYGIGKWGLGIDVTDGKIKDMRKAGIIDPAMVTKEALNNAISVALTILSTDAVISNVRES